MSGVKLKAYPCLLVEKRTGRRRLVTVYKETADSFEVRAVIISNWDLKPSLENLSKSDWARDLGGPVELPRAEPKSEEDLDSPFGWGFAGGWTPP